MSRICLVCGKTLANGKCICDDCKIGIDIEKLCEDIIGYTPNMENNPDGNLVWDEAAGMLDAKFSRYAIELAEELESPRKEYQKIHGMAGEFFNVPKDDRNEFYELYENIELASLSLWEQYRLKGLMLYTLLSDYRYQEAENLAYELADVDDLPWQVAYELGTFYNRTRRYDAAEQIIYRNAIRYQDNSKASSNLQKVWEEYEKLCDASLNGKREYLPQDRDNAREKYVAFMASIGINVKTPQKVPKPIPKEDYPEPVIAENDNFDSFVAFDFETTGLSPTIDCIIEIGAVKVVGGKVVESKEFIFSEFVKPYEKSLSPQITKITGITPENLADARPMWEVTPDFMNFVGDNVLLGYNNVRFDSKFLTRAGRYSNMIIDNPQFDVLAYAKKIQAKIGYDRDNMKLNTLAEFCGVENPAAHRAWADALTTAKVYLKLREMV